MLTKLGKDRQPFLISFLMVSLQYTKALYIKIRVHRQLKWTVQWETVTDKYSWTLVLGFSFTWTCHTWYMSTWWTHTIYVYFLNMELIWHRFSTNKLSAKTLKGLPDILSCAYATMESSSPFLFLSFFFSIINTTSLETSNQANTNNPYPNLCLSLDYFPRINF